MTPRRGRELGGGEGVIDFVLRSSRNRATLKHTRPRPRRVTLPRTIPISSSLASPPRRAPALLPPLAHRRGQVQEHVRVLRFLPRLGGEARARQAPRRRHGEERVPLEERLDHVLDAIVTPVRLRAVDRDVQEVALALAVDAVLAAPEIAPLRLLRRRAGRGGGGGGRGGGG